ncbi:cytochrome b N-terminal domain-containing protein [bacterium]|nr:cytochrome b N-terminal domain-containing protein [bacterium]
MSIDDRTDEVLDETLDAEWMDQRTGWRGVWNGIFLRMIPKVNWSFTLGSATLFVVVNQFITGILLTIYYVPSPQDAYDTVLYITNELPAGWLIRGMHHWGATAMVALAILHMLRVIYYGAYKFPREVTWISGVMLLLITFGFGFTGYLLPWDQKAYWATTVGTKILEVTPVVGESLLRIARGGDQLSAVTLSRFFGIHVWVLPAVLLSILGIHLYLVIRIGISAPAKREE